MKPSELFCFKDTKKFAALSFFLSGSYTRMMQINPPDDWLKTGWTRDSQARTRLVDSLFCITRSLQNHASFVLLFFFLVTFVRN